MSHRYGKAHCRLAIGEALLGQREWERARQILEEALENFMNCADQWAEADTCRVLALAYPSGHRERLRLLRVASRIFADLGDLTERDAVLTELSRAGGVTV